MRIYGGAEFPAYVIDDRTLREELLSEEDTREWLEEVPDDPHAVDFWRMLGELDRALDSGQARLLEREPFTPSWAAAAVRLAHVHHWRDEYAEAHDLLDAAEEVFGADPVMLAFVLQHRAKAFFDEGRYAQARDAAAGALALREEAAAEPGLVEFSRETLARIEEEV